MVPMILMQNLPPKMLIHSERSSEIGASHSFACSTRLALQSIALSATRQVGESKVSVIRPENYELLVMMSDKSLQS
jgi:hypothetical protein